MLYNKGVDKLKSYIDDYYNDLRYSYKEILSDSYNEDNYKDAYQELETIKDYEVCSDIKTIQWLEKWLAILEANKQTITLNDICNIKNYCILNDFDLEDQLNLEEILYLIKINN